VSSRDCLSDGSSRSVCLQETERVGVSLGSEGLIGNIAVELLRDEIRPDASSNSGPDTLTEVEDGQVRGSDRSEVYRRERTSQ